MKPNLKLLYLLIFFLITPLASGSDQGKEKRWSEQIVDSLLVGEAVTLEASGTSFLGIYTEAEDGGAERAAIVAHGIGAHPNWQDVVYPLRTELPAHGWATLSIQMPILANDAALADYAPLYDEVGPRIDAAVKYLRDKGAKTIVLIGHSLGAGMAASYLSTGGGDIDGLVAVGLNAEIDVEKMNAAQALEKIKIPVLDLYGSRDLEGVMNSADARVKAARKAGNDDYRQERIEGADHFFVGSETLLVRTVRGWLKSHFGPPDPSS
jgi:pimeloyl-ACP methyl ester carboxylesterase